MPFLTHQGVLYVNPAGNDRKLVGGHWHAIRILLETGSPRELRRFRGRSIFDTESRQRFSFITDPNLILGRSDEYDFDPGFYKRGDEVVTVPA